MPLKLKSGSGKLTKTRIKREGGEKGKIAAMFLSFEGLANKSNLKAIFNTPEPPNFWEDGGRKATLYPYMGKIPSTVEYSEGKLTFLGQSLTDCTFRNFTVLPQEGNVFFFTFEVKCHPSKAQVGVFETELLGEIGQLSADANILIDPTAPDDEEEEEEGVDPDLFEQAEKL